jgi:succinyl-CoA synthetase beta subunit
MVNPQLLHKSDVGAVALNLNSIEEVIVAVESMRSSVSKLQPDAVSDSFLVESMVAQPIAELLVSVREDSQFGWAMTLASGGVLTEVLNDAVTVLIPASMEELERSLNCLKISKLMVGYRGAVKGDVRTLISSLGQLQDFVLSRAGDIKEIEINPLFVLETGCIAIDALVQLKN